MSHQPYLRIVRGGEPTPQQLAAVVAALSARDRPPAATPQRSGWADRSAGLRGPLPRGPGAWRASALPAGVRKA